MSTGGQSQDVSLGALTIDISQFNARLQTAQRSFQGFASRLTSIGQQFSQVVGRINQSATAAVAGVQGLGKAVGALSVAAGAGSVALIKLASDANEAASKFGYVFGKATEQTTKQLDAFAKTANRSKYDLREMAADIGALLGPMGFTKERTGELSVAFTKLATDLSSFFNVSEKDALIALRAGIVGESEPLRRLGVQLNEAKIQQEAFRLGLAKTKDEVNGAAKAQAILSLILQQTKQAQGDAARTADQFANSYRGMSAAFKDASTDLGMAILPAATRAVQGITALAQPMAAFFQENRERIEGVVTNVAARVKAGAQQVRAAFEATIERVRGLGGSFDSLTARAGAFAARAQELWSRMPAWAQDALMVAAGMGAISTGLTTIGSQLPIVGMLAGNLGRVIDPLTIIKGLVKVLAPLLGVLFSPIGATVAAATAAVYGLYKAFQSLYKTNETFRESWDRIVDKAGPVFEKLKTWAAQAAEWLGEKLGGAMDSLTDGAVKNLSDAWGVFESVANKVLEVVEAIFDLIGGDGERALLLALQLTKALNSVIISVAENLAKLLESIPGIGKAAADALRQVSGNLKTENTGIDFASAGLKTSIQTKDEERSRQVAQKKAVSQAAGAVTGAAQSAWKWIGEQFAAGQVEYQKAHPTDVAQAQNQVAQAQATQGANVAGYDINLAGDKNQQGGPAQLVVGRGTAGRNRATLAGNAQAMRQIAGGQQSQGQRTAASQLAGQVNQFGQAVARLYANWEQLSSEEQGAAINLQKTYQDLVAQFKAGTLSQEAFNKQVKAATDAAQKLAAAEKELTDEEEARLNAQGKLSPRQQQAQQAAMAQFQQNAQQGLQQLQDLIKQGGEAQQQAAEQADQELQAALQSGDPAKVKAALDTMKGYANAQIQQTLLNVGNTAGMDAIRASFGTLSQPGILPIDWNQRLSENPQAAATIKMFEAMIQKLDDIEKHLGNVPKMASGGVVSSPTLAMIGESGPEAVIPLSGTPITNVINAALGRAMAGARQIMQIPMTVLGSLFGNPAGYFPGAGGNPSPFTINPGGGAINPLGLSAGNLGLFGSMFGGLSVLLNRQVDMGNSGALGLLARWSGVQQTLENAIGWGRQRRLINLGGVGAGFGRSMMFGNAASLAPSYNPFGGGSGVGGGAGPVFHIYGVDLTNPSQVRKMVLENVIPVLQSGIRYGGYDPTGRNPLGYRINGRSPLTPSGLPR